MKYLTDRQEIAQAMNFGKYPVIRIDVETPVRFVTDWATTERDIDELIAAL